MRVFCAVAVCVGLAASPGFAAQAEPAATCPGNPKALGTSRTLVVDPTEHTRLGTMQYNETLPLDDHEVVLTFDDGPLPPNTVRVRDILAGECVKATFFMIGRMAHSFPEEVRKTFEAGHTIASHSQNHPLSFERMAPEKFQAEIEDGIANVAMALGDPSELAPFFRIPGLLRQPAVEDYLAAKNIMTWSADFPADDWKHIRPEEVLKRALTRLEAKGRGILLLHDIQRSTVAALPSLLHELKARGYRIVHVVPATAEQPKTATSPEQWHLPQHQAQSAWSPMAMTSQAPVMSDLPAPSLEKFSAETLFNPVLSMPEGPTRTAFVHGRASPPVTARPLAETGSFKIAVPNSENASMVAEKASAVRAAASKAKRADAAKGKRAAAKISHAKRSKQKLAHVKPPAKHGRTGHKQHLSR